MPALEGTRAFSAGAHPAARHAYTLHAGLVLLGMASAVSLLIRHWRSIEAAAAPADQLQKDAALLDEPLLVSGAGKIRVWGGYRTKWRRDAAIKSKRCTVAIG